MESLAKRILNNPALVALCVPDEVQELSVVGSTAPTIRLKRTYTQTWPGMPPIRYWRVVAPPSHPNYQSDLSIEGLKEWGIIR